MPLDSPGCGGFNTRLSRHRTHAQIAQSVEQGIENPRVGSSILSLATIFLIPQSFNLIRVKYILDRNVT